MEIIRDPIWNNIRVDPLALSLVDTAAFQRLRYIRQLGLAYLIYPGATHSRSSTRWARTTSARSRSVFCDERDGSAPMVTDEECSITVIAALLHDIGHYPFSHALEEIGATHHEEVAEGPHPAGRSRTSCDRGSRRTRRSVSWR